MRDRLSGPLYNQELHNHAGKNSFLFLQFDPILFFLRYSTATRFFHHSYCSFYAFAL